MISSQISRPPAQTKLDTPSQEKKIPCPLASNVGNVITANCRAYSVCNELIGQQNYLAATVRSLDEISLHCGQQDFKHSETAGRLLDLVRMPSPLAIILSNQSNQIPVCWVSPRSCSQLEKKKKKGKRHNRHHPQERCGRLRLRTSTPSQFPTRLNVILGKLLGYRDHQNDSIFNYGVSATCWSFQPCIKYASHAYHHVPQCVV